MVFYTVCPVYPEPRRELRGEPRSARGFALSLEGHPRRRRNSHAQRLSSPPHPRTSAACQCPLTPICFQQLPTIKFRNAFVLITMQIAPGMWGYSPFCFLLSACPLWRAFCLFHLTPLDATLP